MGRINGLIIRKMIYFNMNGTFMNNYLFRSNNNFSIFKFPN